MFGNASPATIEMRIARIPFAQLRMRKRALHPLDGNSSLDEDYFSVSRE